MNSLFMHFAPTSFYLLRCNYSQCQIFIMHTKHLLHSSSMQQPYKITYKTVVLYRGKKDMIRGHPITLLFVLFCYTSYTFWCYWIIVREKQLANTDISWKAYIIQNYWGNYIKKFLNLHKSIYKLSFCITLSIFTLEFSSY
jgi:hypothetical protein